MMVVEIVGGTMFGSMALVADGWHMSTHAAALSIAGFAYWFARKHRDDPRFTFGTGKIGELAGFCERGDFRSGGFVHRLRVSATHPAPVTISYSEAILIAVVGLGVNVLSAFLLSDDDEHGHHHHHDDHAHGNHHDTNFRAAYVHVLADALTSVLAIIALLSARFYGWVWMDPAVGLIGAVVIAFWSFGLMRSAGRMLLDMVPESALSKRIIERLELKDDRVSDLHVWQVGPGHSAVIASLVTHEPEDPSVYKARLNGLHGLSHVTIEVHTCPGTH
jgi:cation diffusion facilitator family transporter